MGTPGNALAFLFAIQLVAGRSPRLDGINNKILWVAKNAPSGFLVEGQPLGESRPVVSAAGDPSIVDVPTGGCWTFRLSGVPNGNVISRINLEALPAGTLPVKAATPA